MLRLAQFEKGFAAGADPARRRRSHMLDDYYADWKKGYSLGQKTALEAREAYGKQLDAEVKT